MNWYETDNWYAPLEREASPEPAPAAVEAAPRGKKKIWVAVTAVVLTCALLLGLGVPALKRQQRLPETAEAPRESEEQSQDTEKEPGKGYGFPYIPNLNPEPDGEQPEDGMPEDWDDFFATYYTESDTANSQVNIPRGQLQENDVIRLAAASGRELSLQELYEKCAPSIVAISGYTNGKNGYAWGTGVVLTADGLILTNTHVVEDCDRATVTLQDDRVFEASLLGADTFSDLAVLRIQATGLKPAEFGQSGSLKVGDPVAAIGNPLGDSFRSTLTDGIVSAISRDLSYKGRTMTLLQTNTALNEGNSGGALFNMYGQVVGITNMKMMSSYSSIEGIGFAIPSATAQTVVNSLVRYGEFRGRPSIGITVGAIPPEAEERYEQLPKGLYITDVQQNSDAWAQGVRPKDILLEVNHIPVVTTNDVSEIKDQYGVGDSLHFTIWRKGEILEMDVKLMDTLDLYGR